MGAPKTGNVRNVVLVGQGGVGKTSLAEAMLHLSGKTARLGGHDGTKPTLDYDPEEVKRAFSISTTIAPIDWKGARINVLDAPCYPDFIGDAFAAMSVCETALFVVDAEAGPQPTTVKLWYAAEDLRLARAVFVNRLSRSEASFATTMDLLQERFGTRLGAVTLPWGEGEDFAGIIAQVRDLTGHSPMLPLWTYGFHQSRERYSSQAELLEVVDKYRELKIPFDGIVQDWQYWGHSYLWNAMEFLASGYPNPQEMMDRIHN